MKPPIIMVGNLHPPTLSRMVRFAEDFNIHVLTFGPARPVSGVKSYSLGWGSGPLRRRWEGVKAFRRVIGDVRPAFIHVHYASLRFLTGLLPPEIPLIVSTMGGDILPDQAFRGLARLKTMWLLKRAAVITTKSAFLSDRLKDLGFNSNTVVVNWGVDPIFPMDRAQAENVAAGLGLAPQKPFFLSIRSTDKLYNISNIIESFSLFTAQDATTDLVLTIGYGTPGWRRRIQAKLEDENLSGRVKLLPFLSPMEMAGLMRLCRAAISMPYSDGLAQSFMEARVSGCLLIMSPLPQYNALIDPGRDCLCVPPEDVEALKEAMLRAVRDEEVVARARASATKAREMFDYEIETEKMRAIYREFINCG